MRAVAIALLLAGLVDAIRRRREIGPSFLLAVTVGVLLSVPILADGGARVYAATIATTAALIALGGCAIARWLRRGQFQSASRPMSLLPEAALAIVLLALCGPLLMLTLRTPTLISHGHDCLAGQTAASFLDRSGSGLVLVGDDDPLAGRSRFVTGTAFRTQVNWIAPPGFDALPRPLLVFDSFDRLSGRTARVIRPDTILSIPGSLQHLCGTWHGGAFIATR